MRGMPWEDNTVNLPLLPPGGPLGREEGHWSSLPLAMRPAPSHSVLGSPPFPKLQSSAIVLRLASQGKIQSQISPQPRTQALRRSRLPQETGQPGRQRDSPELPVCWEPRPGRREGLCG